MEQIAIEKFIAKVFIENINPILGSIGLDYVKGPFIDMIHMLIKK